MRRSTNLRSFLIHALAKQKSQLCCNKHAVCSAICKKMASSCLERDLENTCSLNCKTSGAHMSLPLTWHEARYLNAAATLEKRRPSGCTAIQDSNRKLPAEACPLLDSVQGNAYRPHDSWRLSVDERCMHRAHAEDSPSSTSSV